MGRRHPSESRLLLASLEPGRPPSVCGAPWAGVWSVADVLTESRALSFWELTLLGR